MSTSKLIERMQQASFYPHPVTQPIDVIHTHCSIVFLTGKLAYKVKKPVNFGFLNYSTVDLRKHFLEMELTMNKPIAPDIYLEVLPIVYREGDYHLGGEGKIVEYALKMNQFPQESLLINLFAAGKLTSQHMEELGRLVAQFHRDAKTDDYITSFGHPDKIAESIQENYQQTLKYIGIAQTEKQYQETVAFTNDFLANKREIFHQRQLNHKIRECHGDLHLKNMCYWRGKIQLFDRIEFNEPFRFVDVMYDVAFTMMDLQFRDAFALANVFANTYLTETDDWEGLLVLPLYLCRQAYVRAKVTSFLLDDDSLPQEEKEKARQTAQQYYHLAWKYTQPNQGRLILVAGISGSGKTTVARQIAQKINGFQIRSDAVRKHIAGIPLHVKGDSTVYSPQMTQRTYNRLIQLAKTLTLAGYNVLLDAKFDQLQYRQPLLEFALRENIPFTIIHCTAPLSVLAERLHRRQGDISDATPDLLLQQQNQQQPFTDAEKPFLVPLDTTLPEATLSDRITEILKLT
ncbi:MAG: AAA family ATPase [Geminocystis sp.]|nr:AAA family ATPase [Geminocystis sp.]